MMCDGSYKESYRPSCFLSVLDNDVGGTNIIPGHINGNSAHQSETGGMLGTVLFINQLCKDFHIMTGSITSGVTALMWFRCSSVSPMCPLTWCPTPPLTYDSKKYNRPWQSPQPCGNLSMSEEVTKTIINHMTSSLHGNVQM